MFVVAVSRHIRLTFLNLITIAYTYTAPKMDTTLSAHASLDIDTSGRSAADAGVLAVDLMPSGAFGRLSSNKRQPASSGLIRREDVLTEPIDGSLANSKMRQPDGAAVEALGMDIDVSPPPLLEGQGVVRAPLPTQRTVSSLTPQTSATVFAVPNTVQQQGTPARAPVAASPPLANLAFQPTNVSLHASLPLLSVGSAPGLFTAPPLAQAQSTKGLAVPYSPPLDAVVASHGGKADDARRGYDIFCVHGKTTYLTQTDLARSALETGEVDSATPAPGPCAPDPIFGKDTPTMGPAVVSPERKGVGVGYNADEESDEDELDAPWSWSKIGAAIIVGGGITLGAVALVAVLGVSVAAYVKGQTPSGPVYVPPAYAGPLGGGGPGEEAGQQPMGQQPMGQFQQPVQMGEEQQMAASSGMLAMQPGMQPAMQPGTTPGTQPGMQPAKRAEDMF